MMSHNMVMMAQRIAQGGGGSSFNIGLDTIAASNDNWGADSAVAMRVQASASGTLQTAFFYIRDAQLTTLKVGIYGPTDASSAPAAGDTQIGISSTITGSGAAGWVSAAMSGGTVTSGQYYWLVFFVSTTVGVSNKTELTSPLYYKTSSGYYASPPANLSAVTSGPQNWGRISCYITAQ